MQMNQEKLKWATNIWSSPKEGVVQVTDGNYTHSREHFVMYININHYVVYLKLIYPMPTVLPFKMFNKGGEKKGVDLQNILQRKTTTQKDLSAVTSKASQGTRTTLSCCSCKCRDDGASPTHATSSTPWLRGSYDQLEGKLELLSWAQAQAACLLHLPQKPDFLASFRLSGYSTHLGSTYSFSVPDIMQETKRWVRYHPRPHVLQNTLEGDRDRSKCWWDRGATCQNTSMSKSYGSSEDMQLTQPRRAPRKKQHWCSFWRRKSGNRKKRGELQAREGNMPRRQGDEQK